MAANSSTEPTVPFAATYTGGTRGIWLRTLMDATGVLPKGYRVVTSTDFAGENRESLKALMKACFGSVFMARRSEKSRPAAQKLAQPEYVGTAYDVIKGRMEGQYDLGGEQGTRVYTEHKLAFSGGGSLNAPRASYARWFFERYAHFDLPMTPGYNAEAASQNLVVTALYAEVVAEMNEAGFTLPLPTDDGATPNVLGAAPARELVGI